MPRRTRCDGLVALEDWEEMEQDPSALFQCPVCGTWQPVERSGLAWNFATHMRTELKGEMAQGNARAKVRVPAKP